MACLAYSSCGGNENPIIAMRKFIEPTLPNPHQNPLTISENRIFIEEELSNDGVARNSGRDLYSAPISFTRYISPSESSGNRGPSNRGTAPNLTRVLENQVGPTRSESLFNPLRFESTVVRSIEPIDRTVQL